VQLGPFWLWFVAESSSWEKFRPSSRVSTMPPPKASFEEAQRPRRIDRLAVVVLSTRRSLGAALSEERHSIKQAP
jgi:hypothetical protein